MSSLTTRPGTLTRSKILEIKDIVAACRTSSMGLLKLAFIDEHKWVIRFTMVEGQENPVTLSAEDTTSSGINFRVYNFESISAFNQWAGNLPPQVLIPAWNPHNPEINKIGARNITNRVQTKDGRMISIPA